KRPTWSWRILRHAAELAPVLIAGLLLLKRNLSTTSWNWRNSMQRTTSSEVPMAMNLNPLLLEALRSRSDSAIDPALQTLLSGMGAGASGGALPSTQELLGQLESTDPTVGLIAKYLAARQVSGSENFSEEEAIEVEGEAVYAEEEQRVAVEEFERLA